METKQSLSVKVENGTKEVVIRNGEAPIIREPLVLDVHGTIQAPSEFWNKRKSLYNVNDCHVEYSKQNKSIELTLNESNYFGGTIKGMIEEHPELEKFGINKNKVYTLKELSQLLKMSRAFFADTDEATKVVGNLQKCKASIQTQIEKEESSRGDKKISFEAKVDSNIDLNFTLKMPIWKGYKDHKFQVEICLDVRDKDITLWLESQELQQLFIDTREAIFSDELKNFEELVCIEK